MYASSEKSNVEHEYHRWLISLVDPDGVFETNYVSLMSLLDKTTYIYRLPMDKNRYLDGIAMRDRYDYEINRSRFDVLDVLGDKECSILECLVALFCRFSDEILVEPGENSLAPELFYVSLENLGLLDQDDSRFDLSKSSDILDKWACGKLHIFSHRGKNLDLFSEVGKYSSEKYV